MHLLKLQLILRQSNCQILSICLKKTDSRLVNTKEGIDELISINVFTGGVSMPI